MKKLTLRLLLTLSVLLSFTSCSKDDDQDKQCGYVMDVYYRVNQNVADAGYILMTSNPNGLGEQTKVYMTGRQAYLIKQDLYSYEWTLGEYYCLGYDSEGRPYLNY